MSFTVPTPAALSPAPLPIRGAYPTGGRHQPNRFPYASPDRADRSEFVMMSVEAPPPGDDPHFEPQVGQTDGGNPEGPSDSFVDAIPNWLWGIINGTGSLAAMVAVRSAVELAAPELSPMLPSLFFGSEASWDWLNPTDLGITLAQILAFGFAVSIPIFAGRDTFRVKNPIYTDRIDNWIGYRDKWSRLTGFFYNHGIKQLGQVYYHPRNPVYKAWLDYDKAMIEKYADEWIKFKAQAYKYAWNQMDGGFIRLQEILKDDYPDEIKLIKYLDEFLESAPVKRFIEAIFASDPKQDSGFLAEKAKNFMTGAAWYVDTPLYIFGAYTPKTWGEILGFGLDIFGNTLLSVANAKFFGKNKTIYELIAPGILLTVLVSYANKEIAQSKNFTINHKMFHRAVIGSGKGGVFGGAMASPAMSDSMKWFLQLVYGGGAIAYAYYETKASNGDSVSVWKKARNQISSLFGRNGTGTD